MMEVNIDVGTWGSVEWQRAKPVGWDDVQYGELLYVKYATAWKNKWWRVKNVVKAVPAVLGRTRSVELRSVEDDTKEVTISDRLLWRDIGAFRVACAKTDFEEGDAAETDNGDVFNVPVSVREPGPAEESALFDEVLPGDVLARAVRGKFGQEFTYEEVVLRVVSSSADRLHVVVGDEDVCRDSWDAAGYVYVTKAPRKE